jgi:ribosomal protein S1
MKKTIAIIVAVLFVFALTSISFAAEKKAAPAPVEKKEAAPVKAEEKKAPEKVMSVTGDVVAVDAKAMTLTVKGKKGDVALSTNDKTTVKMGKEKKALADVKVGDKVKVKYTEVDGKNIAKSIAIKPAVTAAPAEKKAEPVTKKPAEKKAEPAK